MDSLAIPFATPTARRVLAVGVAWIAVYLAARFAIEARALPDPWDQIVAFAPVPAFLLFAWTVHRALAAADELHRRIQLEAMALAFLATIVLLMTLGLLLRTAVPPFQPKLHNLWAVLPPLWGACLGAVNQHYR